jgi:hypothetical protein
MMKMRPVMFQWNGTVMIPQPRFLPLCSKQYAVGEEYPLLPVEERSMASHNQYFAAIADGWHNIPESMAARWPSEEHLRKWCLIETNFFNESEFDFESVDKAKRFAAFYRKVDDYARIFVHEKKVIIRVAKSQSLAAMGKDTFQASKTAVLDLIENLIGVKSGTLRKEGGQSA